MKKFNYFWFKAPAQSQLLYKIALGLGVICLIIGILGANTAINGDFFKLPVFEIFMDEEQYENFTDNYDDVVEEMEDLSKSEIREFEEETGVDFEKFEKYFTKLSLKNLLKVAELINEYEDGRYSEEDINIYKMLLNIVTIYAVVICLLTLLFIYCGSGGLAILTYIISLPFHILLTGTGYLVFATIFVIAYVIVQGKLNKEYKRVKRAARGA